MNALQSARVVVDGLGDAAAVLDRTFHIKHFNSEFARLSGLRRKSLVEKIASGATAFTLLDTSDSACSRAAEQCLNELRVMRLHELVVENGLQRAVTAAVTMIPLSGSAGNPVGLLLILRDVSAEREVQDNFKRLLALEKDRSQELERQVEARTRELRAALDDVTRLSETDALTGVANRRAFVQFADHALQMAERYGRSVAVIMADVDHFKRVNDSHGHIAGDEVLKGMARVLRQSVRATDRVARFGGEEFIVLLTETQLDHVCDVAQRLWNGVRTLSFGEPPNAVSVQVTASFGIALYPDHGRTLDELVKRADQALYRAKHSGRDKVVLYDPAGGEEVETGAPVSSVLVASSDELTTRRATHALSRRYRIVTAGSAASAFALARLDQYEAVVVDEELTHQVEPDLLTQVTAVQPDCVRILVAPSSERFAELRKRRPPEVDGLLLSSELETTVVTTIEDGLTRRDVERRRRQQRAGTPPRVPDGAVERLDALITDGRVNFLYQPLVSASARKVFAYEALCRADDSLFSNPELLFDVAVLSGRILRLSRLARARAVDPMRGLPGDQLLFINLHPAEIEDALLASAESALAPWAQRVVFEVTERACIVDLEHFQRQIQALREMGYRIAVDDLGAGYASLNSLALLEPDFVKIDRAMVQAIPNHRRLRALVQRIAQFAGDSGMQVIAEGVETKEQAELLLELGCDRQQGWYYGRAAPPFLVPTGF